MDHASRSGRFALSLALLVGLGGCERAPMPVRAPGSAGEPPGPDPVEIDVQGPTLIAFHPVVSNDSLERDEDLAAALDDFAFHLAGAMDSLTAHRFRLVYHGGDTVWLRLAGRRERVVPDPDSADIGYLFADTAGPHAIVYGVRTSDMLIAWARVLLPGDSTAGPRPHPPP